ncbi:YebC/PmpR family DNA-binding transcriptional regulator [Patescibacteria group bacterium]|nr:YebC/PmpR family DNA-binding transcriptional regulator [Patescibacteria group bacterium]
MSGHSHAKTVARTKGTADAKRSKAFSKMARVIIITAKEGGGDPNTNSKLRIAIEQAKQVNMPKDKIERSIKKGTGELEGGKLESVIFEAYGPNNIAIILEGITDNKNRTLAEVKKILNQYHGKLANEGSVKWLFERKGSILVNNEQKAVNTEELEMDAIEAGAEDILEQDDFVIIYTKPDELEKVKKNLEEKSIKIESSSLDWIAKESIEADNKESLEKLFGTLDDNDDIQNIYSNLKP